MSLRDFYFLAILPSHEVSVRIEEIRQDIQDKFGSRKARNAPPHITLIPPFSLQQLDMGSVDELYALLQPAFDFPAFRVELNGYGAFGKRVLFISIEENLALVHFQERLHGIMLQAFENPPNWIPSKRVYHPHVTLASKDLDSKDFVNMKESLPPEFRMEFSVNSVCLMQHDGTRWLIRENWPFS